MDIKEQKKLLRQDMLARRAALTTWEVEEKSRLAADVLFSLPCLEKAETLLIYLAVNKELLTRPIIERAWELKKTVLIPVCLPDKTLLLSKLSSFNDVEKGFYGLLEPTPDKLCPVSPEQVDLAILPGLAFDTCGHRLGYGGGYFDQLLPLLRPDCRKIALAYDFQVISDVPVNRHDAPVDAVVTEKNLYRVISP